MLSLLRPKSKYLLVFKGLGEKYPIRFFFLTLAEEFRLEPEKLSKIFD